MTAVCASLLVSGCDDGTSPTSVQSQPNQGNIVTDTRPLPPTLDDYRRAEQMLAPNLAPLLIGEIRAHYWQDDDRLIIRRRTENGSEYVVIDPAAGSSRVLFDSARVAALLEQVIKDNADNAEDSEETNALDEIDAADLNLRNLVLENETLRFEFAGDTFALDLKNLPTLDAALAPFPEPPPHQYLSPNGERAAFIREHNLWVRSTDDGNEVQLTFDGEADYGYATNSAGWIQDSGPVLLWSPDSSKIATFRQDSREVKTLTLVETAIGRGRVDTWKYPLPGDEHVFMLERVVIHLDPAPRLVPLAIPAEPQRSTTTDHIAGRNGEFLDVEWSADSAALAFVSSSRDHKIAQLRLADIETGEVRDVYKEVTETYYESGFDAENWQVLHASNEFIWFSERSNWGHLYLGDLASGEIKAPITAGNWAVLQMLEVDPAARTITFLGSNKEAGDPYFQYLYLVGIDGGEPQLLSPEPAHHEISPAPSGRFFLDSYSTPTTPPVTVLRSATGEVLLTLANTSTERLIDAGWVAPEPFVTKARDRLTDIHGLLYRPSNFDESLQYPVLNYLYPGPQTGSVGSRAFSAARRDKQAVAELGFIVVELDAMGTPGRSKSFHDAYYADMGDNGLPDQIAAIRQLAESRRWMDLDRVGIWGHSGGGFASTAGILRYPDFYKVAVSGAGNHDNRNYEDDWGEKWQGLLETTLVEEAGAVASQTTNYDGQANQLLADRLQGKLLLAHGLMDDNVHPSNTLLVVQALIDAEKDFDLLMLPDAGHGFGNSRYFMKKRWDYFVRHLAQVEPVAEFRFAANIP
jgi:dipeptidyl aminopeptidase/acylaminoacyl peptidase